MSRGMKSARSYTATKHSKVSQAIPLLLLTQSPNIQLSNLMFQIVCLHSEKDKFFTSGKTISMDRAEVETQKSWAFQQGKLQGNWDVLRPCLAFLVVLLLMQ